MTSNSYDAINLNLHKGHSESASVSSMENAAKEIHMKFVRENKFLTDCPIGIDGTWQKRGHSSLNGVVTGIARFMSKFF